MEVYDENADFVRLIDEYNAAYEDGREEWLANFHPDASIYTIGAVEPFTGRAGYEDNFRGLLKEKRSVELLKRDVHVSDDTAVVMQLLRVTQSQVRTVMRESTIWKRQDDSWKIIHMHTARVLEPAAIQELREPRAIRVLSARLASVSSQVGVAQ